MPPDPSSPIDLLMTPHRAGDHRWRTELPDGWQQGRGLFGGLVVGAMIRALEEDLGDPSRALRSLTAELVGPVQPGAADFEVELLRAGSNVTTLACRLLQGGEVQGHAVAVLGKPRTTQRDGQHVKSPAASDWRSLEVVPVQPPFGPDFARFFEFRSEGPLPISGLPVPDARGWVRPKSPGTRRDAAFIACCIDAWWPALYAVEDSLRPMATVAFTLQLLGDAPAGDDPLYFRSTNPAIRDGYVSEQRELWTADGRLVALNPQTFVIIK